MKHLSLLVALALFLPACPTTTPGQPTTPSQPAPSDKCPDDALLPAELGAPLPPTEPWTGQVPPPPSASSVWVVAPADSEQKAWWLLLVEAEKNTIARVYALPEKDVGDAVKQVTAVPINMPRALLAVLSGARPLPIPPGPVGGPDIFTIRAALNAGRGVFWGDRLGAEPPIPRQINKAPQ